MNLAHTRLQVERKLSRAEDDPTLTGARKPLRDQQQFRAWGALKKGKDHLAPGWSWELRGNNGRGLDARRRRNCRSAGIYGRAPQTCKWQPAGGKTGVWGLDHITLGKFLRLSLGGPQ